MTLRLFAVAYAVILLAPAAFGQAAAINGQIEGTVTDPSGAAVSGADVAVRSTDTGFARSLKTDASGLYRFPVLPLGSYELTVNAPGFAPSRRAGIQLNAGTNAVVDVALTVSSTATEIVVTAAAPIAEPGRIDIGSTLSANQVTNLPLISRNNFNFILLQPNVSGRPNTELGVPRKVNANGFSGRINYQLDGTNNTQGDRAGIRLMPVSNTFIGEIQQVNNGFAPEFGNTVGTVFNAITKSGANDLHGEGAFLFRRKAFTAAPSLLAFGRDKPELSVNNFFGNAGGSVIKDKLFFFGGYEYIKRDLPSVVSVTSATITALGLGAESSNTIPFAQEAQFVFTRGDWQVNDSNRVMFRYNYFRNESPYNSVASLGLASTTTLYRDRARSYSAQWVSTLSPVAVNELRFQAPKRFVRNEAGGYTGPGPIITITGQIQFNGSVNLGLRAPIEQTPEIVDNFSFTRGRHQFKTGGALRWVRNESTQAAYAQYTFPSVQAYLEAKAGRAPRGYASFFQRLGNLNSKFGHQFNSLYFQDAWKVRPNVTFSYGVRHDVYRLPEAPGDAPYEASRSFRVDRNNWAPRMGLAWGLGKDQKTVVRASAGLFYDPPQTDVYRRSIQNNGNPLIFNITATPAQAFAPNFPGVFTGVPSGFQLPIQSIDAVSPRFRSLYSSNANVQVTREIAANMSLSLGYLFTKGTALPVYRNINVIPGATSLADGRPIFLSPRADPRFSNIVMAEAVGSSSYNGMNMTLNRRFARGFEVFATYTWSHSIDDAPEQNNIDSGATVFPSDPTNRRRDRGNSLSDRRHALNMSGVLAPSIQGGNAALRGLVNGNRLAFIVTAISGDVFNVGSNRVLNNDSSIAGAFQRPLFIGRNTYRGPATRQFDLRYSRVFPIRERWKPEFFAEFTNLFNSVNVTGINTTATVDTLGVITTPPNYANTGALDQRLLQFGFRLSF
jgi:hypothetical protein